MVSEPAEQREAVGQEQVAPELSPAELSQQPQKFAGGLVHTERKIVSPMILTGIFIAAVVLVLCIGNLVVMLVKQSQEEVAGEVDESGPSEMVEEDQNEPEPEVTLPEDSVEPEPEIVRAVDFQPAVDAFVQSTRGGNVGVAIYDLDLERMVGEYQSDKKFATASVYKLFVAYEGYLMLMRGELVADDIVAGHTVLECLDLAIRESDSSCAETIWRRIGYDNLDRIMEEQYGMDGIEVSRLTVTPLEVVNLMKMYYYIGEKVNAELLAQIKDSLLNQPAGEYDWRQGLPKGFSEVAQVYNKVGWNWDPEEERWTIYNDAAIIDFVSEERHFIVVVMTNGVSPLAIRRLGAQIEAIFSTTYAS